MAWQFHPLVIPLLVGAVLMGVVFAIGVMRRKTPGALPLALLSLALGIYTLGYAGELGSQSVNVTLTWLKIEYLGVVFLGPLTFLTILDFTEGRRYIAPSNLLILLAIPIVTLLLALTAEYHNWIWQDLQLEQYDDLKLASFTPGIWYLLDTGYTLLLLAATLVLLLRRIRQSTERLYRRQALTMLVAVSLPVLVYAIYLIDILPIPLDINPFMGVAMAMLLTWAMFEQQLFDVAPIARETLLNGLPDGVIVVDVQNRIIEINPAARRWLGLESYTNVAGQPLQRIMQNYPHLLQRFGTVAEAKTEVQIEVYGRPLTFDLRITPLYDYRQQLRGRLIVLTNITARVNAEQALQASYERILHLREIDAALGQYLDPRHVAQVTVEGAADVTGAHATALLLHKNEALVVLAATGKFPIEQVGKSVSKVHYDAFNHKDIRLTELFEDEHHPLSLPAMAAQIVAPMVSGERWVGTLVLESDRPGQFTTEDVEMIRLLSSRASVAIDNAEMYEERTRLADELEAFGHTVAHDLKNPLGVIIGYAGLLLGPDVDEETRHSFIKDIEKAARKSINITNALLTLAKVRRTGGVELAPVNMTRIVADALERFEADLKTQKVVLKQPESWPSVLGYGPWIEEIWANYISNAIKYGGDPPVIELGYKVQPDNQLSFWVKDNGEGLTDEQKNLLFQPFTRLSQERAEGHGLGLSIVQRITEKLGGGVGVESTLGEGSCFYFTLPATHPPEALSV